MLILGIETSGRTGGVALLRDGQVLAKCAFCGGSRHSRNIMVAVEEVVRKAGVGKGDVEAVAVSEGPGSFTGLRVGVMCAKTLACLLGWKAVGAPSLEVMVQNVDAKLHQCSVACPVLDARRSFVYATVFRWESGRWVDLTGVLADGPERVAARIPPGALIFGSGVGAYPEVFLREELLLRQGPLALAEGEPENVARLGLRKLRQGKAVTPIELLAKYYRRTEAEEKVLSSTQGPQERP